MEQPIHEIYADGTQAWYLNGKRHREDGPAYIGSNGTREWYLNGKLHRADGPALIEPDSTQYWVLNDRRVYSMKEYQKKLKLSDEDVTALILKYGNIE